MDDVIKQGVDAFRAGKRDEARKLLLTAVEKNPDSESAWGWLYNVADNNKERIYCLKQVLRINPNNEKVNQLYKNLLDKQSQLENNRPQVSKQINLPVSTTSQTIQRRPVKNSKTTNTKNNRAPLILIGALASIALCIFGFFTVGLFFNSSNGTTARVLAAQDVFEVSAIDVVEGEGYTVTSAVCEVISSERYSVQGYDFGKIVFHAFRITKPTLGTEAVVLFASNHTASDGSGLVQNVNPLAKTLFPDFPDGANLKHPITMDTPGAQEAIECVMRAGQPPAIDMGDFDVEAWRREAIKKFGPEQTFDDGSKDNYVRLGFSICKYVEENPSVRYDEGSDQQWIVETFCPYVK